jgi:cytidine deaminase
MGEAIDWEELFRVAGEARLRAHAPYSHFAVGAAALYADGSVVPGCNVENASYGATFCAERTALVSAVARGLVGLRALALVVDSKVPTPPCGMCRQVMAEFADGSLPVRSRTLGGDEARYTLGELLPHAFGAGFL